MVYTPAERRSSISKAVQYVAIHIHPPQQGRKIVYLSLQSIACASPLAAFLPSTSRLDQKLPAAKQVEASGARQLTRAGSTELVQNAHGSLPIDPITG